MIQTLQKRFILTAMIAISVFVLVLLGVTNGANAYSTYRQNRNILRELCENAARGGTASVLPGSETTAVAISSNTDGAAFAADATWTDAPPQERSERHFNWFGVDLTDNYKMSAIYFVVTSGEDDNTLLIDTSRIPAGGEQEAREIARSVIDKGEERGRVGDYRFLSADKADGSGKVYIFHDISYQRYAVVRVAYTSLLVGILCIEVMYFFVRVLARRSIAPIAKNIERQKQFITDAGHELKTPVAIIMANTEAMELCTGETKWSRNIREQAQRLSGLTQNLLTLAKIDETTFMESVDRVSLTGTVNSVTDMFREPAALKHILIDEDVAEDVIITANPDMMTRLISTLMDNAVKYASADSTILITLKKADNGAVFVIKNHCDELPNCEPEKLFDRFYRADAARTQKKGGGYGIGLSAAQAIVELHKGTISVKYEPENVIAFTVKL